jgi:3-oxoadipate enol-lactonase
MQVLMRPWGHSHYRDHGPKTGLPIVFLNSLGTDLRMWDGVTARLPAFRCIGMDKRGHGLSATPTEPWTIHDLADDALALLDHLNIERALIAGCSIGGIIAQAFAARHPARTAGLFLSNTAPKVGTDASWQARIDAIRAGGLASIAPSILDRWFAPSFLTTPEAKAWATMLLRNDVEGYIGTCRVLAAADLTAETATIRAPTLCLAGSADQSTPPDLVRATAALIPGATLTLLDGSGHLPAIDAPTRVADLISAFHRSLP